MEGVNTGGQETQGAKAYNPGTDDGSTEDNVDDELDSDLIDLS